MIKKVTSIILISLIALIFLVVYNYVVTQRKIKETKTSVLSTDIVSYPETILMGNKATFIWNVQTPNDLNTTLTTIYYGYKSTPTTFSNITLPDTAKYDNYSSDYLTGVFKLPDNFETQVIFNKPGKVYFRSYAKINDQNLWSKEYSLTVLPKTNDQ